MLSLDLFDSRYERDLREGAVDDLEARRIDDLNAKMDDLIARAREAKTPEHKAGLKREFDKVKDERNSYFKVRNKMMDHGSLGEAKADYNFDAEDLKRLERIRDLPTLKAQAFELISRPSAKPMKPEKVEWFKNALEKMNSPLKVIKLMYDLLLSGEGHAVVGSKSSMNPNNYRQRFGEEETNQAGIPGNVPTEKIPGKEELLKGRGRNYYEDQKKNSDPVDEHGGGIERMLGENPPEAFAEGSQDFNKVEPYYVCLAGKPVKKFDYYQDARRFHDNWKQKLYREGNKAKADKVTLMPVIDEGIKKSAVATALAACIAAGGTLSGCATNPSVGGAIGTVRDVGTAAKTASTMTRAGVQDELSQELRNFIRAQGGDPGGQNLSLLYKLQKRLQGQKDSQPINEVKDTEAVEQAILKRIMVAHRDMLVKFGPEKIMTAASDVAYNVGDVDEIGTSDVSAYVQQVKQILGAVA